MLKLAGRVEKWNGQVHTHGVAIKNWEGYPSSGNLPAG